MKQFQFVIEKTHKNNVRIQKYKPNILILIKTFIFQYFSRFFRLIYSTENYSCRDTQLFLRNVNYLHVVPLLLRIMPTYSYQCYIGRDHTYCIVYMAKAEPMQNLSAYWAAGISISTPPPAYSGYGGGGYRLLDMSGWLAFSKLKGQCHGIFYPNF